MKDATCHVQPDINGGKSAVITFHLMTVDVLHDVQANESQLFKYVLFFYRFMPLKRLLKIQFFVPKHTFLTHRSIILRVNLYGVDPQKHADYMPIALR